MKLRIVPRKEVQKAYKRDFIDRNFDIKEEKVLDDIDKVPKELFSILSEVLTFIEKIDREL
jgi:type III secretion system FlhB-like substrate exporter